ncbi:hypothetical protein J7394_19410 [Ruegeria sp. R13_0]|uniref:hypothetical protein n=1 Tax=Ruegeria sp. R13_0 TaxID=2821099 RepID=UPI001ADA6776|nr:hypothetical protein [Ruegeria sp. R13_0]MBO9436394.1 hypothetical protein [Ruegeria sp. R13_0]
MELMECIIVARTESRFAIRILEQRESTTSSESSLNAEVLKDKFTAALVKISDTEFTEAVDQLLYNIASLDKNEKTLP